MGDLFRLIWYALIGLFRSRAELEAEILVLRHQLNVLRRKSPKRVALNSIDRLLLVGLYRLAPGVLDALKIVRPETLMRWHRAGFRAYWRWKSYSGRQHAQFGAKPLHFAAFGDALIWGLEQQFGAAFTPEMKEAWIKLYDDVQREMIRAGLP